MSEPEVGLPTEVETFTVRRDVVDSLVSSAFDIQIESIRYGDEEVEIDILKEEEKDETEGKRR